MSNQPEPRFILTHPVHLLSFGFGTGLSPKAPGTVGTLVGFPLYMVISPFPAGIQAVILVILFVIGIRLCDITGRAVGEVDHSGIVWDEIVCFAMVLVVTPIEPLWWLLAFVAFRFFDIVKPWPASWIDNNVKTGFGVMADDLVAAIYAGTIVVGCRTAFY